LTATEAYEKGLVTRVVPDAQSEEEAYATARRICAGAPLVAGWHKQWIRRLQSGKPLNDEEKAASFAFLDTEDYKEGLAAFLEKAQTAVQGTLKLSCRKGSTAFLPRGRAAGRQIPASAP
jgi:enoyl-CoA hydratase/carnithine racemase